MDGASGWGEVESLSSWDIAYKMPWLKRRCHHFKKGGRALYGGLPMQTFRLTLILNAGTRTIPIGHAPNPCNTSLFTLPLTTRLLKREVCTMYQDHTVGIETGCLSQLLMHPLVKWNLLKRCWPKKNWKTSNQFLQTWREERPAFITHSWSMGHMLTGDTNPPCIFTASPGNRSNPHHDHHCNYHYCPFLTIFAFLIIRKLNWKYVNLYWIAIGNP